MYFVTIYYVSYLFQYKITSSNFSLCIYKYYSEKGFRGLHCQRSPWNKKG